MHFSLATILTIVPLLASASPLAEQPRVTIPLVERSNLHLPDGSVNVEKLRGYLASSLAPIMRGFDNYERNTGQRHPMHPKVAKRDFGSEPLVDEHDSQTGKLWHGTIFVGTPPVPFTVVFDTDSGNSFLPAVGCSTCSGHNLYDPSASSTCKDLGKPYHQLFQDRSYVLGNQYTDSVTIVGLAATSQTLAAATYYGPGFSSANFTPDGLLGMGFQSSGFFNAPLIVNTLLNQGQISSGVFAFKLRPETQFNLGELTIGGLNPELYSGTPFYTPVVTTGFWVIRFSVFTVGSTTVIGANAHLRSRNPFTTGPLDAVQYIYNQIPGSQDASSTLGQGFYTFPCSATIPSMSFTIGDFNSGSKVISMSAASFNFGPVPSDPSTCVGSITANPITGDFWLLGDSFMRNTYTIFDYDNNRVGFADLV